MGREVWETIFDEIIDTICKKKDCSLHHENDEGHRYKIIIKRHTGRD